MMGLMRHLRWSCRPLPGRPTVLAAAAILCAALAAPAGAGGQAASLIVDHTCTNLEAIPDSAISTARDRLRVAYGHTSHGSQPMTGMHLLMDDPANNRLYDFTDDGTVQPGMLSIADWTPYGDLGNHGDLTWAAQTREYLDGDGSDRNVMIWSWCGGVSDNTVEGINAYLDEMNRLEGEYPGVTFVYMTGHLDGTGVSGTLNQRNEQIRAYCRANGKVLFDFADIESYDPDGDYFLDRGARDTCDYDGGNWAEEWCAAHAGQCESCNCAHSHCLNCQQKGKAFWWMFANLVSAVPVDCPCDMDGSGRIDGRDLARFAPCYGTGTGEPRYDSAADFDDSGTIDGDDLAVLAGCFGMTV